MLVSRVRSGLECGEFRVAYQPIVDVRTRTLQGVECLLRWQHPDYGMLLPGCFVAALKDRDVAQRAVRFVLGKAVHDLANLRRSGLPLPRVAVNIEPFQLLDETLGPTISGLCTRYGVSPSLIELELVETEDVSDLVVTDVFTGPLTQLGVRLALDDFGSGYTSLRTLAVARFDTVKLAGELFRGVPQLHRPRTVVIATLDLLAKLGVTVVAEGIETQEQLHWLAPYPDIQVQGFHIGRPKMTLMEAIEMVYPQ
jgi:EAL domain-containing protein (putative c-di-GMP-specific phosphodiesterase class I)